jgi:hypothetical protein
LKKSSNQKTPLAFGTAADEDKKALVGDEAFGLMRERNQLILTENQETLAVSVGVGEQNPSQKKLREEPHGMLFQTPSILRGVDSNSPENVDHRNLDQSLVKWTIRKWSGKIRNYPRKAIRQ